MLLEKKIIAKWSGTVELCVTALTYNESNCVIWRHIRKNKCWIAARQCISSVIDHLEIWTRNKLCGLRVRCLRLKSTLSVSVLKRTDHVHLTLSDFCSWELERLAEHSILIVQCPYKFHSNNLQTICLLGVYLVDKKVMVEYHHPLVSLDHLTF
jgi:hypothetical protein